MFRKDDLSAATHAADEDLPAGLTRIAGTVFASPSRVKIHRSSRLANSDVMETAYPDICFAVGDSQPGFDELVESTSL